MPRKPKPNPVGPPLKNPETGYRKMVSMRLDQKTLKSMKHLSRELGLSKSEVVDLAVDKLFILTFP